MITSNKPIIEHIPYFLDYCKETGLSEKTHENYKHYFISLDKNIVHPKYHIRIKILAGEELEPNKDSEVTDT